MKNHRWKELFPTVVLSWLLTDIDINDEHAAALLFSG